MNTQGIPLKGNSKTNNQFVTAMEGTQLLALTTDPRLTENAKARESHVGLEKLAVLRGQLQRAFAGAKAKNVAEYAKYIVAIDEGLPGITPQIVLYTADPLTVNDDTLFLPWGTELVAIDGETQLAARFEAIRTKPSTAKQIVDVRICHGLSIEEARKAFHDLNSLAVRVNSSTALAMDTQDALTAVTRNIAEMPFFKGRVSSGRQLGKKDTAIVTFAGLRAAVVSFYEGTLGFQHANKPVRVPDARDFELLDAAAKDWFELLSAQIGPVMEKRTETVAAAPSILAALGALGNRAAKIEDRGERLEIMNSLVQNLDGIDWKRGTNWEGLAGHMRPAKRTKSGKTVPATFSTGGSGIKDSGMAALAAIYDHNSPAFFRVRGTQQEMLKAA